MTVQPKFGRYTEIPFNQMTSERRNGYDYVMGERGMCPAPYKIWVENPPLMNLMVPIGTYYKKRSSLNDAARNQQNAASGLRPKVASRRTARSA